MNMHICDVFVIGFLIGCSIGFGKFVFDYIRNKFFK